MPEYGVVWPALEFGAVAELFEEFDPGILLV
jgi:hypothetical protein